ncbi:hypothetical protein N9L19_01390 [bacterium]|nr:hypothetical protein [bacterium]
MDALKGERSITSGNHQSEIAFDKALGAFLLHAREANSSKEEAAGLAE